MAQTIPIYIDTDTTTSASIADGSETAEAAITTNSGGVGKCLLWGVHGKLSSTGGEVTVRVYDDDSSTSLMYEVLFDFADSAVNKSDLMNSPIPLFATPYFVVEGDGTSAGKTINLTFYVQALRG